MPIRIDWEEIKSKLGDVTAIYALTHRQASLILSVIQRLEWRATFRDFDYDYADWDLLQQDVADLNHNLTMPVNLVDIIALIDEVEELLRKLTVQSACCVPQDITEGDQFTDPVIDGVGNVPQNIIDAGYASGPTDWNGFDDYKCMIANVQIENMVSQLNTLAPYVDNAGAIVGGIATIAAIIGAILTGTASFLVIGILGSVAAAAEMINNITSGALLETLADDLWAVKDEAACQIYLSDGVDNSVANLKTWIDNNFGPVDALILKNMNLKGNIKALYGGRYDTKNTAQILADAGFETTGFDCSGCSAPVGPVQLLLNPDFDTDLSNWTVTSYIWSAGTPPDDGNLRGTPSRTEFTTSMCRSANFTIPSGRTSVYMKFRLLRVINRDIQTHYYLYRASDNQLIWNDSKFLSSGTAIYVTQTGANKAVVPGETYYIRLRVQIFGGTANPTYTFLNLWTTT